MIADPELNPSCQQLASHYPRNISWARLCGKSGRERQRIARREWP